MQQIWARNTALHAPPALMRLTSCSACLSLFQFFGYQALRHKFLKPSLADLTVDATAGDDGHEHTTVKLQLLDIELLQLDGGDRATTGELLMREAELTKLTAVEQVQPG